MSVPKIVNYDSSKPLYGANVVSNNIFTVTSQSVSDSVLWPIPSHILFWLLKDLRRKIDALKENILSCQNEIDEKAEAAANIEQQIDKLEVK